MRSVLETKSLSKCYGSNRALQDCTLQIPDGRIVGLVGPNGAGKTTLLHLVMGLLDPSAGSIEVLGYSPQAHPREVLARVGFVAQSRPLYKNLTVEQHLHLVAGLNHHWDNARATERLAHYDIPLKRKIGSLSGGQQAQVSLALALAKCPRSCCWTSLFQILIRSHARIFYAACLWQRLKNISRCSSPRMSWPN